jgi:hypothetical protein
MITREGTPEDRCYRSAYVMGVDGRPRNATSRTQHTHHSLGNDISWNFAVVAGVHMACRRYQKSMTQHIGGDGQRKRIAPRID